MKHIICVVLLLSLSSLLQATSIKEPEALAGFARLYGIVRFFHPSDAAQQIDWNKFAIYCVQEISKAQNSNQYETTIQTVFQPVTTGLRINTSSACKSEDTSIETSGDKVVAWRHLGPGLLQTNSQVYLSVRTNRMTELKGFATMMQTVPAQNIRGQRIRLVGHVRADAKDPDGRAALWLRVDRSNGAAGFFDNMNDRPIRDTQWHDYAIEGDVAQDADSIAFGVMLINEGSAGFDGIQLSSKKENGTWQPIPLQQPGFESEDGWAKSGDLSQHASFELADENPPEGKHWLKITLPGKVELPPPFSAALTEYHRMSIRLAGGLCASVPIELDDSTANISMEQSEQLAGLQQKFSELPAPSERTLLLADIVVAWSTLRHFYPYWDVVGVDWDRSLEGLFQVPATVDEPSRFKAMRKLIEKIKDGHARIADNSERAALPIDYRLIENQLVVVASITPDRIQVGDSIEAINGVPTEKWVNERETLISGSNQLKQMSAPLEYDTVNKTITFTISHQGTKKDISLQFTEDKMPLEKRPQPVSELKPGIWYVDLTNSDQKAIEPHLQDLSTAKGVIFDVRGYPTDAGFWILSHLLSAPEEDRWMHIPEYVLPGANPIGFQSVGWDLKPEAPEITPHRIFLTDARAISYAESVMGYVKDKHLATIVGSQTAGTNGNVATIDLPGEFQCFFTGMKVTKHDGTSQFHLFGVEADVKISPTIAGIQAGRDEVLEKAISLLQKTNNK
jgi:hypothetical protein